MSFISDQASYGQPADYVPRNQELEGANLAYKDLLPKKAHLFADQIGRISGEYLTPDRPFYDQFKNQLQEKTKEFQKRLDSGENIGTITNEMSNFRNQISGTLDAFKKRKDMFEAWNSSLEKNDKIDSNTKTALRNLALDNISNITSKKGLTLDLPLPSPAVPVNYDTKGAEIVDKLVEKEGHETYGSKWYEIAADPTKFANFKSGVIQRDPAKIKAAVLSGLANDPEVQSSLDQDAELHLHNIYKNSEDPNDKFHIQQNAGQLHEQIKQLKLNNVSNLLAWTKQGLNESSDRTIIDNTERTESIKFKINNPISDLQLQDEVYTVKNPIGSDLKSTNAFIDTKSKARDQVLSSFLQEFIDKNNILNNEATKKVTPEDLIKQGYNLDYLKQNADHLKGFSPEYVKEKLALADQLNKEVSIAKQRKSEAEQKINTSNADQNLFKKYGEWSPGDYSSPEYLKITNQIAKDAGVDPTQVSVADVMRHFNPDLTTEQALEEGRKLAGAYNRKQQAISKFLNEDHQISTWSQTAMPGYAYHKDKDGNINLEEDGVAVAKNTKMVNDYFKNLAALRGLKLKTLDGSNDIDTVLKTLGVEPDKENKVDVGTISLTKTPSDYSEQTGKTERAFVIPISYGSKTVKVKVTTDQINSLEIRALINQPEEKANVEYETGRIYGLKKYDVYGNGKVIIDYGKSGDKSDDKFIINGTTYTGARGMYYLANALQ